MSYDEVGQMDHMEDERDGVDSMDEMNEEYYAAEDEILDDYEMVNYFPISFSCLFFHG